MLRLKKRIRALLEKNAYDEIAALALTESRAVAQLVALSYDKRNALSWRAMEAIGRTTGEMAKENPEDVRNLVGRLLWMIRDESGGIGWSVPETLGEIVKNNPKLCADIAPIIVSFHDEKMLTGGVLWAVGSIGAINDETVTYAGPVVRSFLKSPEPVLRGFAARASGALRDQSARDELMHLKDDSTAILVYENNDLVTRRISDLASHALSLLKSGPI